MMNLIIESNTGSYFMTSTCIKNKLLQLAMNRPEIKQLRINYEVIYDQGKYHSISLHSFGTEEEFLFCHGNNPHQLLASLLDQLSNTDNKHVKFPFTPIRTAYIRNLQTAS